LWGLFSALHLAKLPAELPARHTHTEALPNAIAKREVVRNKEFGKIICLKKRMLHFEETALRTTSLLLRFWPCFWPSNQQREHPRTCPPSHLPGSVLFCSVAFFLSDFFVFVLNNP
jgi:hypothetical protein